MLKLTLNHITRHVKPNTRVVFHFEIGQELTSATVTTVLGDSMTVKFDDGTLVECHYIKHVDRWEWNEYIVYKSSFVEELVEG